MIFQIVPDDEDSVKLFKAYVKTKTVERVTGGLGAGTKDKEYDTVQLNSGIKVELEHTTDKNVAKEIAKDHLTEDPNYYIKLRRMEGKG